MFRLIISHLQAHSLQVKSHDAVHTLGSQCVYISEIIKLCHLPRRIKLAKRVTDWLNFFYLNINQLDALHFYNEFIVCLYMFRAQVLIIRRSQLYYTASGIVTPIGGRALHRLREDLCTERPPTGMMIPGAV